MDLGGELPELARIDRGPTTSRLTEGQKVRHSWIVQHASDEEELSDPVVFHADLVQTRD